MFETNLRLRASEVRSLLVKMWDDRVDGRRARLLCHDVNVWE